MPHRLECTVQRYAWGDRSTLPALLGIPGDGGPYAELWMGAHPGAPSLIDGHALNELIAADPERYLGVGFPVGGTTARRELPMLFKVLAAAHPLSVQAHPSTTQAAAGFGREQALGLPLDAPNRTYRDANHKPELLCAVTRFEARCGFRPIDETLALLDEIACDAVAPLQDLLRRAVGGTVEPKAALAAGLRWLLELDREQSAALTSAVVAAALDGAQGSRYEHERLACGPLAAAFPGDIGVIVLLLLNRVLLEPGQALFLGPGVLHAYLGGVGMELMANSDNVVRGGLTSKHVDIDELLRIVDTTPGAAAIETPISPVHTFSTPAPEFSLTRVELDESTDLLVAGPAIVLLTAGAAWLDGYGPVRKGEPLFIEAAEGARTLKGTAAAGLGWIARPGPV